ncbi:N-acetyltransferase [Brachybacterium halotolerans subsp. kimchii]|uniref:GNAT family N-acetyltransferase n=1 Tax=Brachybacterium halotolerans TaxID=2795215 RepID=UPI001E3878E8|nr:GNAT family N-acetyltransferase [Brachybacterium halotolerans]UEJ83518.1 N-acetyltransferase [Brachybacterium halotolerans subsp. kimchii]
MGARGRIVEGLRIAHAADRERFEALLDDRLVGVLQYGPGSAEGVRDLRSTVVSPEHGGQGIGTALVREALTETAEEGLDVEATCWFARGYLERHPEGTRSTQRPTDEAGREPGEGDA